MAFRHGIILLYNYRIIGLCGKLISNNGSQNTENIVNSGNIFLREKIIADIIIVYLTSYQILKTNHIILALDILTNESNVPLQVQS